MANNIAELQVLLTLKDKVSAVVNKMKGGFKNFAKSMKTDFLQLSAKIFLFEKAIRTAAQTLSKFIDAASKVEQLQIRLKVLFGSVEEGNKLFKNMEELASNVPKTYDEIMESATNLAAVVRGGADEVTELMPIIVDLSAATGIAVRDVTSQMIRMYSAGAASADMFRERGVLAMLGFQAGVSYTAEETMKQVVAAFEAADSKFRGASEELKTSWEGTMSMLSDAMFKFNQQLGEFITKSPKVLRGIEAIIYALGYWADYLDRINDRIDAQTGNLGLLNKQLEIVNKELQRQMELLATSWLGSEREAREQKINELLQEKSRIIQTIIRLREEQADRERQAGEEGANAAKAIKDEFEILGQVIDEKVVKKLQAVADATGKEFKDVLKAVDSKAKELASSIQAGFSNALSGLISGAKTAKEAFTELGQTLIKIIADYIAETIVAFTIGKAIQAIATKLAIIQATALAAAWEPAAVFAAIATAGGAVASGVGAIGAGLATVAKMSAGFLEFAAGASTATPMASGGEGVVTKPTLFLAGEAGAERFAFQPLGRPGGSMGGDINISLTAIINRRIDIKEVVEELGIEVQRQRQYSRGF